MSEQDNQEQHEEGPERAPLSAEDLENIRAVVGNCDYNLACNIILRLIAEVEWLSDLRTHDCNVLNLLVDDERALRQTAEERAERAEAALGDLHEQLDRKFKDAQKAWGTVVEKDAEIKALNAESERILATTDKWVRDMRAALAEKDAEIERLNDDVGMVAVCHLRAEQENKRLQAEAEKAEAALVALLEMVSFSGFDTLEELVEDRHEWKLCTIRLNEEVKAKDSEITRLRSDVAQLNYALSNEVDAFVRLQAEAAAMKKGLKEFCIDCGGPLEDEEMECRGKETTCPIRKDLNGDAGKAMLERVGKLDACARILRDYLKSGNWFNRTDYVSGSVVDCALKALSALDGKEG